MNQQKPIKIAASILSSDLARLGEQVREAERGGADLIHVDVMDGQFVPNITFGPGMVAALRPVTRLPLSVHLMIASADRFLDDFAKAGADTITLSLEASPHLHRLVEQIKAAGKRAGVALNPITPVGLLEEILPFLDAVLVMTVNPGFGGQSFIPTMPRKIRLMRKMIDWQERAVDLAVDGGIDPETALRVVEAGANVLIAGSAIFQADTSVAAAIDRLKGSIHKP